MSTTTIDSPKSNQRMTLRYNGSPTRPTLKAHGSTLSLASPTKLNVVHSDWEPSKGGHIPLLKRNSSNLSQPTTDRFIPSRFTVSNGRVSKDETLPPPNASPSQHIKAQSQIIYKKSVADACGIEVGQRVLQYQPLPPQSKSLIQMNRSYSNQRTKSTIEPIRSRKITSNPERVLDAPGLIDDFYLNPISWSCDNYLAIALDNGLYVWNASSGSVHLLTECDFTISSVRWSEDGSYLSIGKEDGSIEVWDIETSSKLRTMQTQSGVRIGSQSWSNHLIGSGCKTGEIFINDVRIKNHITNVLTSHIGEVCGLEYRSDGQQFASGSNDNTVCIWDCRSTIPQFTKTNHTAAIKALSWNPDLSNLLATGGGSSDKFIHFWNTTTGARVNSIDTGSQISSLFWGSSDSFGREIVATGGYPNNCISIYSFEHTIKVAEIENAHDSRIISGQLSPDGSTLATIGGDENLKFYKIFNKKKKDHQSSIVNGKNMSKMTIR